MAPPSRKRDAPLLVIVLLAIAVLVALLEWDVGSETKTGSAPAPALPVLVARAPEPAPTRPVQPAAPISPRVTPREPVVAEANLDVESNCHGIGAYGVCEGNVAKACVANAIYTVDCASHNWRCVMTGEGATCLPQAAADGCNGNEPATCSGHDLRRCIDGVWTRTDCEKRGGSCVQTPDGARCSLQRIAQHARNLAQAELCDGHDNDLDGRVDENGVCDAVPLVAYVPAGYTPPDLDNRMQQELAILNRIYAPTMFRWEKVATASGDYRNFNTSKLKQASRELARSELASFYVAVLYVEALQLTPPKSGLSTLPNNRCGGVRLTDRPAPADGLIVLAEGRQPETLAHEMGHYLGLCHTHEEVAPLALVDTYVAECKLSGDGICDTAPDPGPEHCLRDAMCQVVCPSDGAHPDPSNVMSYYIGCRRELTPEQLSEAQRNLSLRRGWFRCLDPTACACAANVDNACPMEMSCQPTGQTGAVWGCELDGAAVPGSRCDDTTECSGGSFCLKEQRSNLARCVRPCELAPDCTCLDVGLGFPICEQDLPEARALRTRAQ